MWKTLTICLQLMCCFRAWNALCLSGPFHWPDQNLETMDVRSSLFTQLWPHIAQIDLKVLSNYSFQLREEEKKNQYFSINTNWHSSPLYWLIMQIFHGITVISFCYWSISYIIRCELDDVISCNFFQLSIYNVIWWHIHVCFKTTYLKVV